MNNLILSCCLVLSSIFTVAHAGQSLASKLYAAVLGNQDVKQEYKELVQQALKDVGVKNPQDVCIKQMNGVGPAFAGFDLSSFTACGIWLDEKYLDTCTHEEKLFHSYHEASHYALSHHQKIIAGGAIALPLTVIGLMKIASLQPAGSWRKYALATSAALAVAITTYCFVLPWIVKRQEQQADQLATKTLLKIGKGHVVDDHVHTLKTYVNQDRADTWWYSPKQQKEYFL